MSESILDLQIFEQRFRQLFEQAPFSAALLSGDDLVIEMANEASLQLWGKDKNIIGKALLEGMPEMSSQEVFKILLEVYHTGETYEGKEQVAFLNRNGSVHQIFVNLVYKALKDDRGKIAGVFAIGYDVTDLVVARQRSEASDTRARLAIEATRLGTFELNYKTSEAIFSARTKEIFGGIDLSNRKSYIDRIHPDDLYLHHQAHREALRSGDLRCEVRLLLADQSLRWVKINGTILFDESHAASSLIGSVLDITEEKLLLQEVQESEERFRTLITETPEVGAGIYIGRELKIQYVNDVMLQFWGKDASVIGKTMSQALPELEGQSFFGQLEDVFATGNPFVGKEVKAVLNRNGRLETAYFDYTYKGLRNSKGEIYGIHHMTIDVTIQVNNKLMLIESEEEIRDLIDQTPVAIAMCKTEVFTIQLMNDALLGYWGKRKEEVIGLPLFEALPGLTGTGIQERADQVFHSGSSFLSADIGLSIIKGNTIGHVIVRFALRAMKDWQGNTVGLLVIINDVTDLVQSRELVEQNELRLLELADSMPQVVWMADGEGNVTYYNKKVLAFEGVRQNEDGSWSWQAIVHADDLHATANAWTMAVATKTPYQIEHRIMMKDGSFRWHLSRANVYKTEDGDKWYGTATDVHNQKLLEMNLEEIVRERTIALQRSNDDLQQFAHVASHDLKEPVRKIRVFTTRLQEEFEAVLGEDGSGYVQKILGATDRMTSMINGILSYASMPSAKDVLEDINLSELISDIRHDLEVLLRDKNAQVHYENLPSVKGLRELIYQLFYNLINNALKFENRERNPVITIIASVTTVNGASFHEIVVQDNGIGFDQKFARKIFSSFVRLNPKDKYEGSGLGLAICQRIVERHKGMIRAESVKNEGTKFLVYLPV